MKFLHPAYKWHLMKSLPEVNVTWFLILRAEYTLRMFENEVFMRIFAPKMDEVTGCSRKVTKMYVTCMPHELLEWSNWGGWDRRGQHKCIQSFDRKILENMKTDLKEIRCSPVQQHETKFIQAVCLHSPIQTQVI